MSPQSLNLYTQSWDTYAVYFVTSKFLSPIQLQKYPQDVQFNLAASLILTADILK